VKLRLIILFNCCVVFGGLHAAALHDPVAIARRAHATRLLANNIQETFEDPNSGSDYAVAYREAINTIEDRLRIARKECLSIASNDDIFADRAIGSIATDRCAAEIATDLATTARGDRNFRLAAVYRVSADFFISRADLATRSK